MKQSLRESNDSNDADSERAVKEWGRLLALARISSISAHFKSLVDPSLLDDISNLISRFSEIKIDETWSNERGKTDDEKDDKLSRKKRNVSRAHKMLKEYKLFFQGAVMGSSKID